VECGLAGQPHWLGSGAGAAASALVARNMPFPPVAADSASAARMIAAEV
jgi:hypothetical protein